MKIETILREGAKPDNFAPWHFRTAELTNRWLKANASKFSKMASWTANNDGSVSTKSADDVFSVPVAKLVEIPGGLGMPFKIKSSKRLTINSRGLTDIWGAPDTVRENLKISCPGLKTLEHLKTKVGVTLIIDCQSLERFDCQVSAHGLFFENVSGSIDFHGVNRFFDIKGYVLFGEKSIYAIRNGAPLLSFLKMPRLQAVNVVAVPTDFIGTNAMEAIEIINNHVADKDILACQEALIDKGLEEYAEL